MISDNFYLGMFLNKDSISRPSFCNRWLQRCSLKVAHLTVLYINKKKIESKQKKIYCWSKAK